MQYQKGEFTVVPNIRHFYKIKGAEGVFCCMCRHADKNGRCHPSYKRIAELTGIKSNTTIKAHLDILVEQGFLSITSGARKRRVNEYQIEIIDSPEIEQSLVQKMDTTSPETVEELYPRTISNNYIQVGVMACKSLDPNNYNSWFKNRTQRSAAEEVGKLSEKNVELLDFLVGQARLIQGKEYAPQIRSPWEFMQKLEKLRTYLKREGIIYKPVQDSSLEDDAQELGYSIYD